jgi:hypothetical protein
LNVLSKPRLESFSKYIFLMRSWYLLRSMEKNRWLPVGFDKRYVGRFRMSLNETAELSCIVLGNRYHFRSRLFGEATVEMSIPSLPLEIADSGKTKSCRLDSS